MWKVIYVAPSQAVAEQLKERMGEEGILVRLRPLSRQSAAGNGPVELMVPRAETEEAHEILTTLLSRIRL